MKPQLRLAETCWRPWVPSFRTAVSSGHPGLGTMRSCFLLAVLLALAAYYVYIPVPGAVSDPWKLMLLDATFRSAQQVVS